MQVSKEAKVGILTVVCGVLLYFGFNFLKGIDLFTSTKTYYAIYDQIGDLQASNPVVINGYEVGRVSSFTFSPQHGNKIIVTLDIDENVPVSTTSTATLEDASMLGGKQVVLDLNTEGQLLGNYDTIISKTEKSMTDVLVEQGLPMMPKIDSLLVSTNALMVRTKQILDTVSVSVVGANAMIANLNSILLQNKANINGAMASAQNTMVTLEANSKKLQPMLDNFQAISDSLKAIPMPTMAAQMQVAVEQINESLVAINEAEGSMGKFLKDSTFYDATVNLLADVDSTVVDFKEHPKRYVHFSVFGKSDKPKKEKKKK